MHFDSIINMIMYNTIKTNNPMVDMVLTSVILGMFSWIMTNFNTTIFNKNNVFDYFINLFSKKNTIIIEGKKTIVPGFYGIRENNTYSNRFKALWDYIIKNIDTTKNIYQIKENHTNNSNPDCYFANYTSDTYMVSQDTYFTIDDDIYAKTVFENDDITDDESKKHLKHETIKIYIYSYKYSLSYLKKYIDNITDKYIKSISESRVGKQFVYSLKYISPENKSDIDSSTDYWNENKFDTARSFDNLFFDGKEQLLEQINFFLNNKEWYYANGIPYTLGIGLHGMPGTGKTSFIKALAKLTERHIVVLSFKMIKTKHDLENFFFEHRYNEKNENYSIGWDKKIIVFEDIDCMDNIVLDRNKKIDEDISLGDKEESSLKESLVELLQTSNALKESELSTILKKEDDNKITLDDILNLWDGIIETPGRMIVITSNHYNELDPALVRPGRIDITHEMTNASHKTISQIYNFCFKKQIDTEKLSKINEYFYTPAELYNKFFITKNEDKFLESILKNVK